MIKGIGTDITEYQRFEKHLAALSEKGGLIRDVFSEAERDACLQSMNPLKAFSAGFACKESVYKAFGKGWMNGGPGWTEIELLFTKPDSFDDFEVRLNGLAQRFLFELGNPRIHCDLIFEDDYVICTVILEDY